MTDTTSPDYRLHKLAELFAERNADYGNDWERFGRVMNALFPEGLSVKSPAEWERLSILHHIVGKLTRYTNQFQSGGHPDSLDDMAVYSQILQMIDAGQRVEFNSDVVPIK